jgi:hypothetical protein
MAGAGGGVKVREWSGVKSGVIESG